MRSVECLSIGDFIVVIRDAYTPEKIIPNGFEVTHVPGLSRRSGEPVRVVAIGAPFVICEQVSRSSGGKYMLDSRYENWSKVDDLYVREYCRLEKSAIPEAVQLPKDIEEAKQASKSSCPVCLERMTERQVMGRPGWRLACTQCRLELVPYETSRGR